MREPRLDAGRRGDLTISVTHETCSGDAIGGFDRVVRLTFRDPVDATGWDGTDVGEPGASLPAPSSAAGTFHLDLLAEAGNPVTMDVVDQSGHLVSAVSGAAGVGAESITASNVDATAVRVAWTGSPCDTVHLLTIAPDFGLAVDRPTCHGDAMAVGRSVILTFDQAVNADTLDTGLFEGRTWTGLPAWTATGGDSAGGVYTLAIVDDNGSVVDVEAMDPSAVAAPGAEGVRLDQAGQAIIEMVWVGARLRDPAEAADRPDRQPLAPVATCVRRSRRNCRPAGQPEAWRRPVRRYDHDRVCRRHPVTAGRESRPGRVASERDRVTSPTIAAHDDQARGSSFRPEIRVEAADLAALAEAHGWDGVFTWDGIAIGSMDTYDPWVVMAAMAMRTERVRLGAIVTPPARRRPWKLARETMTLDRLSNGRLVLPVGLGATDDAAFGNVGEPTEARIRAERLDESLAILPGLWTGEPFGFDGRHYRFGPMTFRPTPVQQPRIPIWVVGAWPNERSMRRTLALGRDLRPGRGRGRASARSSTGPSASGRPRPAIGRGTWSPRAGRPPTIRRGAAATVARRTRPPARRGGSSPTGRAARPSRSGGGSRPVRRDRPADGRVRGSHQSPV